MIRLLLLLLLACPMVLYAQEEGSLAVQAEIIPATLMLSISSTHLNFGEVGSDAGEVRIDPASGERGGLAFGPHSTGSVLLTGDPGYPYMVQVSPPTSLYSANREARSPTYSVLVAQSSKCEASGFTQAIDPFRVQGAIGEDGCARLQIGGLLTVSGATPGIYEGVMSVHIIRN